MKRRNLFITIFAVAGAMVVAFLTQYIMPKTAQPTTAQTTTQTRFEKKKIINISQLPRGSYIVFNWPTEVNHYNVNILIRGDEGGGMGHRADLYAYNLTCTHLQCQVKYNEDKRMLECPCHGSLFDPISDAKVIKGPAVKALPKSVLEEDENGDIYAVDLVGELGKGR